MSQNSFFQCKFCNFKVLKFKAHAKKGKVRGPESSLKILQKHIAMMHQEEVEKFPEEFKNQYTEY